MGSHTDSVARARVDNESSRTRLGVNAVSSLTAESVDSLPPACVRNRLSGAELVGRGVPADARPHRRLGRQNAAHGEPDRD